MWTDNAFEIFWTPNFAKKKGELLEDIGVKLVVEDEIIANLRDSIESIDD